MTKENQKHAPPAKGRVLELRAISASSVSQGEGSFDSFISSHLRESHNYKKVNASNEWSAFMGIVNS